MSADILEMVPVANAYCDGVAAVHIDKANVARVNLYADEMGADGQMVRILVSRLTMSRETMREIAAALMKGSMIAAARAAAVTDERSRKLN